MTRFISFSQVIQFDSAARGISIILFELFWLYKLIDSMANTRIGKIIKSPWDNQKSFRV